MFPKLLLVPQAYKEEASGPGSSAVTPLDRAIDLVDDFGWNKGFLINVGDVKGKILDSAVQQRLQNGPGKLKLAVELGTFLGYGTLRLARMLNQSDVEIITVDPDVFAYSLSSSLYEQAQVRDRITMKTDYSYNVFAELKKQGKQIDLLFVDHAAPAVFGRGLLLPGLVTYRFPTVWAARKLRRHHP